MTSVAFWRQAMQARPRLPRRRGEPRAGDDAADAFLYACHGLLQGAELGVPAHQRRFQSLDAPPLARHRSVLERAVGGHRLAVPLGCDVPHRLPLEGSFQQEVGVLADQDRSRLGRRFQALARRVIQADPELELPDHRRVRGVLEARHAHRLRGLGQCRSPRLKVRPGHESGPHTPPRQDVVEDDVAGAEEFAAGHDAVARPEQGTE